MDSPEDFWELLAIKELPFKKGDTIKTCTVPAMEYKVIEVPKTKWYHKLLGTYTEDYKLRFMGYVE